MNNEPQNFEQWYNQNKDTFIKEKLKQLLGNTEKDFTAAFDRFFYIEDPNLFGDWTECESSILAELLAQEVLFIIGDKLMILCNDVFAWGCADCEPIKYSELENFYKMYKEVPHNYGIERWCCLKRNMQPQRPVKQKMIEKGA